MSAIEDRREGPFTLSRTGAQSEAERREDAHNAAVAYWLVKVRANMALTMLYELNLEYKRRTDCDSCVVQDCIVSLKKEFRV